MSRQQMVNSQFEMHRTIDGCVLRAKPKTTATSPINFVLLAVQESRACAEELQGANSRGLVCFCLVCGSNLSTAVNSWWQHGEQTTVSAEVTSLMDTPHVAHS